MTDALGALTYAELGAMHPQAGGLYRRVRAFSGISLRLDPLLRHQQRLDCYTPGGGGVLSGTTGPTRRLLHKAGSGNHHRDDRLHQLRGTRESARVQDSTTLLKVTGILVMSALFLIRGKGLGTSTAQVWPDSTSLPAISGFGLAMVRGAMGLAVVLLGSPAYLAWRRRAPAPMGGTLAHSPSGKAGE